MSRFDDELRTSLPSMFDAFGSEVLIKGIKVPAIFEQEPFLDGEDFVTSTSIKVDKNDTAWFSRGDSVYVDGTLYKVKQVQDEDEVLTTVELNRA